MKRTIVVHVVALLVAWTLLADARPVNAQPPAGAAPAAVMAAPCIGPLCCDQDACQEDCRSGGLIGGVGVYFIQPYFENNPAFTVTRSTGVVDTRVDRTDLRHHMTAAPELWLGYVGESGLGARLRWWYFRQGTDLAQSVPADTVGDSVRFDSAAPLGIAAFTDNDARPASIAVTSKLQLQVWDLEAMQTLRNGAWDFLFSGGLRLAHVNQHYNAYVAGDSGGAGGPITASVESGHSFHGAGPVVALDARRRLADSGLALYGVVRGSLLFGSAKQSVVDTFQAGAGPVEIAVGEDHRSRVMPVGELELGVEYRRGLDAVQAFGQLALVGQGWIGAGNASRSTQTNSFGVPDGGSIIDNDLGFFGLVLRLGVDF